MMPERLQWGLECWRGERQMSDPEAFVHWKTVHHGPRAATGGRPLEGNLCTDSFLSKTLPSKVYALASSPSAPQYAMQLWELLQCRRSPQKGSRPQKRRHA
jgi:hypothetical protein